jgi:hypothetical protein
MLETLIQWFLIGTAIKLIYEVFYAKTGLRRRIKDQASDLLAVVAVIFLLALIASTITWLLFWPTKKCFRLAARAQSPGQRPSPFAYIAHRLY